MTREWHQHFCPGCGNCEFCPGVYEHFNKDGCSHDYVHPCDEFRNPDDGDDTDPLAAYL